MLSGEHAAGGENGSKEPREEGMVTRGEKWLDSRYDGRGSADLFTRHVTKRAESRALQNLGRVGGQSSYNWAARQDVKGRYTSLV